MIVRSRAGAAGSRSTASATRLREGEAGCSTTSIPARCTTDTDGLRVVLFVDFERPCRWAAVEWLNRLVRLALAPHTDELRRGGAVHDAWEKASTTATISDALMPMRPRAVFRLPHARHKKGLRGYPHRDRMQGFPALSLAVGLAFIAAAMRICPGFVPAGRHAKSWLRGKKKAFRKISTQAVA